MRKLAYLTVAFAFPPLAAAQQVESVDELAAQATDPTASLMSFQFYDWYTADSHGSATPRISAFRAAIPFTLGGTNQIFRVTQPYVTSTPSGATGFADTTIFDLVVFGADWGRWVSASQVSCPRDKTVLTTDKADCGAGARFCQLGVEAVQRACSRRRLFRSGARTALRVSG